MLVKNEDIKIEQVENGFIVSKQYGGDSKKVFQSMQELINFLIGHFDHRASLLYKDTHNQVTPEDDNDFGEAA